MSADDKAPPGVDLNANAGPRIVSSMIALIVLPTIFVIGRLLSRSIARAGFWWDDLWVVIALCLSFGPPICVLVSEQYNSFGRHIWALQDPQQNTIQFLRILYVYEIFYYSSTSAVKVCILLFYRRIFKVNELKWVLYSGGVTVAMYYTGSLLATIFQCSPISFYWLRMPAGGHCTDGDNIQIVPGAINCALDALIIALPIPLLWRLRTTASQKGVLTGIFICAGFVCIISIIRLCVLARLGQTDVTWNYVDSAIWSAAEPSMGVISACLPSLRPLISLFLRGTVKAMGASKLGKGGLATTSSGSSRIMWPSRGHADDERDGPFLRLEEGASGQKQQGRWGHDVSAAGPKERRAAGDEISLEEINVPDGAIKVKDEVVVTSSDWIEYKDKLY